MDLPSSSVTTEVFNCRCLARFEKASENLKSFCFVIVRFIYSEKVTKFCEIFVLCTASQIIDGDFGLLRIYDL